MKFSIDFYQNRYFSQNSYENGSFEVLIFIVYDIYDIAKCKDGQRIQRFIHNLKLSGIFDNFIRFYPKTPKSPNGQCCKHG